MPDRNDLSGTIPTEIGGLTNLQVLGLGKCHFTVAIVWKIEATLALLFARPVANYFELALLRI